MRLSDLVAQYRDIDPTLMVEDRHGIPRPIAAADLGMMQVEGSEPLPYVVLSKDADDD